MARSRVVVTSLYLRCCAMPYKSVVVVSPYMSAIPYRSNADENPPKRKYFIAASFDFMSCLFIPVRIYVLNAMSSSPK